MIYGVPSLRAVFRIQCWTPKNQSLTHHVGQKHTPHTGILTLRDPSTSRKIKRGRNLGLEKGSTSRLISYSGGVVSQRSPIKSFLFFLVKKIKYIECEVTIIFRTIFSQEFREKMIKSCCTPSNVKPRRNAKFEFNAFISFLDI